MSLFQPKERGRSHSSQRGKSGKKGENSPSDSPSNPAPLAVKGENRWKKRGPSPPPPPSPSPPPSPPSPPSPKKLPVLQPSRKGKETLAKLGTGRRLKQDMTNPKLGFGAFDDDVDDDVDDEEQDGDVDDEGHDEGHDEGDDEVRNKDVNELEERRLAQLKKEQVWLDEAKSNNEKGNGEYLAGLTPQEREFRLDEQVKKREEIIQIAEVLQNGNPYDCLQEDDRNTLVLWLLQESGRFTMMGRKWNLVNVCGEFILKFEGGAVWSLLKLGYYGAEPQTTLMFAVEFSGVPTILDPDEQVEFEFSP